MIHNVRGSIWSPPNATKCYLVAFGRMEIVLKRGQSAWVYSLNPRLYFRKLVIPTGTTTRRLLRAPNSHLYFVNGDVPAFSIDPPTQNCLLSIQCRRNGGWTKSEFVSSVETMFQQIK